MQTNLIDKIYLTLDDDDLFDYIKESILLRYIEETSKLIDDILNIDEII